jgi:hypothetical protein
MSSLREQIIEELCQGYEAMQPMPDDIFTVDLEEKGIPFTTARRMLENMVKQGRFVKVEVRREGKSCFAYRPVKEKNG